MEYVLERGPWEELRSALLEWEKKMEEANYGRHIKCRRLVPILVRSCQGYYRMMGIIKCESDQC